VAGRSAGVVVLSLVDWSDRRLVGGVVLRRRSEREKEIEILLLPHQLRVLERQVARPQLAPADRALLAAFSRVLSRQRWKSSVFVTPATLLRWHCELVARRWTYPARRPGRPPTPANVRELVVRMAHENPRWGSGGSRASRPGLGSGWPPAPPGRFSRRRGSSRHRSGSSRTGASSYGSRRQTSWSATSSPSTRSS
jgi:putative transposase